MRVYLIWHWGRQQIVSQLFSIELKYNLSEREHFLKLKLGGFFLGDPSFCANLLVRLHPECSQLGNIYAKLTTT